MQYIYHCNSPLGTMTLASDGTALTGLWFDGQAYAELHLDQEHMERDLPVFADTRRWLDVYFSGREPDHMPPLKPDGTAFQMQVWQLLAGIAYGETATYGELADTLARLRGQRYMSAQAVGRAVGRNPISILIPCHRVIGADRSLTGYAAGTDKKAALLRLEHASSQCIGRGR